MSNTSELFEIGDVRLSAGGQQCYSFPMGNKEKNKLVAWEIRGSRWTYSLVAEANADPVELATSVLEEIFGGDRETETSSGVFTNDDAGELELGIFLIVVNENTSDPEDHILIPTTTILANAGYYKECAKLEKMIGNLSSLDFLHALLNQTGMRAE